MTPYSQKNPLWGSKQFASGPDTIAKSGCFITSLGMLIDRNPLVVNSILVGAGAFNKQLLLSDKAAAALGLAYEGVTTSKPSRWPVIAETKFYAPKVPQHFFVHLGDSIIDPLDGRQYPASKYPIKSYRLFYKPEVNPNMLKNLFQKDGDIVWNVRSHNIAIADPDSLETMFGSDQINPAPDPAQVGDAVKYRLTWQDVVDLPAYKDAYVEAPKLKDEVARRDQTIIDLEKRVKELESATPPQAPVLDMTIGELIKLARKVE